MTQQELISLENVAKSYAGRQVLAPLSLAVPAGATTVLIGESGCGKSTLLRLVLGLLRPDHGRIVFDGAELTAGNADEIRHRIGYVVQDGGLFPHLTAVCNVTLLARFLRRPHEWMDARVAELSALVRIERQTLERYPRDLSGGQRQRIGLMRALMLDPPVLLMDEPLGALDPITRSELQQELKAIFERLRKTVIMVTHDMNEAAHFAGRIVVLREGRVIQQGSLEDLLQRPAEPYVREFIRAQAGRLAGIA